MSNPRQAQDKAHPTAELCGYTQLNPPGWIFNEPKLLKDDHGWDSEHESHTLHPMVCWGSSWLWVSVAEKCSL